MKQNWRNLFELLENTGATINHGERTTLRSIAAKCSVCRPEFQCGCNIFQNPLVVPEVQKAIGRAKHSTRQNCLLPRFHRISLDNAALIAEQVCPVNYTKSDVENTRSMLFAFQWTLPDWFWQRRCHEDFVFELDDLRKGNSPVDWQALWLDQMSLLADREWYLSSGLGNRERVLSSMNPVKLAFHAMR